MIRYKLSRIFAAVTPHSDYKKRLRLTSLAYYSRTILENVKTVLEQDGFKVELTTSFDASNLGKATFTVKAPGQPDDAPAKEFSTQTEWGDFLMIGGGRQAAMRITDQKHAQIFYYGNAWFGDNMDRINGRMEHKSDIEKIAAYVRRQMPGATQAPAQQKKAVLAR